MITQDNIQEINQVQFINCCYQDIEKYMDAFTDTPAWLIDALNSGVIELIDYNPESMFDYGSYGIINTKEGKKDFFQSDWIIKEGDSFFIKRGEHDDEKFINHIKKWKKAMREEWNQIEDNAMVA